MNTLYKSALLLAAFSTIANTNIEEEHETRVNDWSANYHIVDIEGDIKGQISHTPNDVCLDNICASSINISSKSYNGIPLSAPLVISVNMEKTQFESNISVAGITFQEA